MKFGIKKRWHSECGYRDVLKLAFPLILSTSTWTLQHFIDRMFLAWYSSEAIAAAVPAGMMNFTFLCLFLGTARYTNTFVAQYYGAKQVNRVGPAVWQGLYFAIIAGICMLGLLPFAADIFSLAGHTPKVQQLEVEYFRILLFGSTPVVIGSACSGFFSGRGDTWTIFLISALATAINLLLDYFMIFGYWIFPRMGIKGAATATVISGIVAAIAYLTVMMKKNFRDTFYTLRGWKFDRRLFSRLMRYGIPNGIQFMIDISSFTLFIVLVGRLGINELAATNIAFNINNLAFMPMLGFGIATSTLVGQYLGRNRPDLAEKSTWSSFHMTVLYMSSIAALYITIPDLFLLPFSLQANAEDFSRVRELVVMILIFIAFYSLFDTMNIVFAAAIKGAGDTRFVMIACMTLSWILMVGPTYVACIVYGKGLAWAWAFASAYIAILGIVFYLRFRGEKWKSMRVIEQMPPQLGKLMPEYPEI